MSKWFKAEDWAKGIEGAEGWVYHAWDKSMTFKTFPVHFSRDPKHCSGVFFYPVYRPHPPSAEQSIRGGQ